VRRSVIIIISITMPRRGGCVERQDFLLKDTVWAGRECRDSELDGSSSVLSSFLSLTQKLQDSAHSVRNDLRVVQYTE
jgi:hypothetical protein